MRIAPSCVKIFMKSYVLIEHVLIELKSSTSFREMFGGFRKLYYFCKRV